MTWCRTLLQVLSSDLLKAICLKCSVVKENLSFTKTMYQATNLNSLLKPLRNLALDYWITHCINCRVDLVPCGLFPVHKTELRGLHFETATQLKMKSPTAQKNGQRWVLG